MTKKGGYAKKKPAKTQDGIKLRWKVPIYLGVRTFGWWAWRRNSKR